jgi:hypothetical protein
MSLSKELRRTRHRKFFTPEVLEDRLVLSAGEGSTFAIVPGQVTTAGQVSTVNFEISPTLFTAPRKNGKLVLGVDVASASPSTSTGGSTSPTITPQIVSITDPTGHAVPAQHAKYNPKVAKASKLGNAPTSAILFSVNVPKTGQPAADYSVQVKGLNLTTGQYLLGFYLPGDVAGTGTVTKADIQDIKKDNGMTAENSSYNFDADVNRDGIINGQDVKIAKEDLGASTQVSPVVSVNLDPASNPAADRTVPFSTVHFAGEVTPNATVTFTDQNGGSTTTATADSTGAYSILVPLVMGSNTFTVSTLDAFGQNITGSITPVVYSPPTTTTPS